MNKWLVLLLLLPLSVATASNAQLDKLKLPPGFNIEVWADNVPNAREMALGDKGTLFVGTRDEGKVYAITDDPRLKNKKKVITIAEGLILPNGVAFRDGALYLATVNSIVRYDDIEKNLHKYIPRPVVVNNSFPKDKHHGWKFIRFSPDGWLYVSIGAPCNACLKDDPRYATIMRMKPDGSDLQIYATGVRNTVGFDWDPKTGDLWFTNNGRDWLGDNLPPDELNHAPKQGMDFGFPYYYGNDVADPKYAKLKPDHKFTKPALELPAHVAPLGMSFYTGDMFPKSYKNNIIIAEHGSWNRTQKVGYRLIRVTLDGNKVVSQEPFVTGWLQKESVWGRPVDVLNMPDGSILVSDDMLGVIYRISYQQPKIEDKGKEGKS